MIDSRMVAEIGFMIFFGALGTMGLILLFLIFLNWAKMLVEELKK